MQLIIISSQKLLMRMVYNGPRHFESEIDHHETSMVGLTTLRGMWRRTIAKARTVLELVV